MKQGRGVLSLVVTASVVLLCGPAAAQESEASESEESEGEATESGEGEATPAPTAPPAAEPAAAAVARPEPTPAGAAPAEAADGVAVGRSAELTETESEELDETLEDLEIFDLLGEEAVVVSGSRTAKKLSESPSTITVITAEDIARSGAHNLPELLRWVPGVHVSQVSGTDMSVSIRGFHETNATTVLLLVDGRYTNWELLGNPLWGMLPIALEEIERIEIIRGPGSALYGQNAFNGVIQIFTQDPEKLAERFGSGRMNQATVMVGNEAIVRTSVLAGGRVEGVDGAFYRGAASYDQIGILGDNEAPWSDMLPWRDEGRIFRGSLLYRQVLAPDLELDLTGGGSSGRAMLLDDVGTFVYDTDHFFGQAQLRHTHEIADTQVSFDYTGWRGETWAPMPYLPAMGTLWNPAAVPMGIGGLLASQGVTSPIPVFLDVEGDGFYTADGDTIDVFHNTVPHDPYASNAFNLEALSTFKFELGGTHNLTLGANYRFTEAQFGTLLADDSTIADPDGTWETEYTDIYRHTHIISAFLQEDYQPVDWLSLFAGLRVDHNSLVKGDPTRVSPRGGLVVKLGDHAIRASTGLAFRNPSVMELYFRNVYGASPVLWIEPGATPVDGTPYWVQPGSPAGLYGTCAPGGDGSDCSPSVPMRERYGNEDLKPERILSVEAGYQARLLGRLRLELNGFYSRYDDRIDLDAVAQTFDNVQSFEVIGCDAGVHIQIVEGLRGFLNYGYIHYVDKLWPPYDDRAKKYQDMAAQGTPRDEILSALQDDLENRPPLEIWGATPEHTLNAGLGYTWNGLQADLFYHFRSAIYWDVAPPLTYTFPPESWGPVSPLNPNRDSGNLGVGADLLYDGPTYAKLDAQHLLNLRLAYRFLDDQVTAAFSIINLLGESTSADFPDHVPGNLLGVTEGGQFKENPLGQPLSRRYVGSLTVVF